MTWKARTQSEKDETLRKRVESFALCENMTVQGLRDMPEAHLRRIPNLGMKAIRYLKNGPSPDPLWFWL